MAKAKSKNKKSLPRWMRISLWTVLILFILAQTYENRRIFRKAYRYISYHYYKNSFKPTDFPVDYSIHGIDISRYQLFIDWNKLQSVDTYGDTIRFRFVLIKATEGLLMDDDMFDEHWRNALKKGITKGAYHYFLPDRSAKMQANNFVSSVQLAPGDLPPVVDIEETKGKSKAEIVAALKIFLDEIERFYGVKPIIYSNISFIEDYLSDDFKDYPFWIAHYYRKELTISKDIRWVFWQHSDRASVIGIKVKVDADVFNGNDEDFAKLLIPAPRKS